MSSSNATSLLDMTINELRGGLVSGALSAHELAAEVIAAQQANADLNSFVARHDEALMDAARNADQTGAARDPSQALAGIPLGIKANINTHILPTCGATPALREFVAGVDAPVAQRLWQAGALLAGKTNMHEFAFGLTSNNLYTGHCRNPYDRATFAGGSSGGSAAAVAARLVPGAVGTDTSCSIRVPAALCGVFGFRPSAGRYPAEGILPISHTRDTAGPMARSMADIRLLDRVMSGEAVRDEVISLKGLRLGILRAEQFCNLDAEVAEVVDATLAEVTSAGVTLVEAALPDAPALIAAAGFPISLYETMVTVPAYLERYGTGVTLAEIAAKAGNPDVAGYLSALLGDGAIPPAIYHQALTARNQLQYLVGNLLAAHRLDAILMPATPLTSRAVGGDGKVTINGISHGDLIYQQNSELSSVAGLPGLVLPAGLGRSGLPVSLEIDGTIGNDQRLLAIGAALAEILTPLPPPRLGHA